MNATMLAEMASTLEKHPNYRVLRKVLKNAILE